MNKHEKPKQLNLKDAETYELAAKLAELRGDTLNGAVKAALREKLERDGHAAGAEDRYRRMRAVLERYWALPVKDSRTADEILGYDENGLPT
jgi:antitoxin VapB